mgnify:CR=1 FL=1
MILLDIKRNYFIIKTGSQDSQKLYEPFPDLFGSFRKKLFVLTFVDHFGTNIQPYWTYFDHFWDQKSEHVYVSMILLSICQCCQLLFRPFLRPICPYIFVLAYFSGYLVSMDQVSMGICGPDIYGYLWTRYLWVSVDQISMDQGPGNCIREP